MSKTDRRRVLRLAMTAALAAPVFSTSAGANPASTIAPPAEPMRYRRTLVRDLAGGARITVTRDFQVMFRRRAEGFFIEGRQVGVSVSMPAGLERFAELERSRVEEGLFPLSLDRNGHILAALGAPSLDASVEEAFAEARRHIATQSIAGGERAELLNFIDKLHQAGANMVANMPPDLFAPLQAQRSARQEIALPTGEKGEVVSQFQCERDPDTGLMQTARREVLTVIEGDSRRTTELWELRAS